MNLSRRLVLAGLSAAACRSTSKPTTMPVLFVGHGSPMNALEDNRWSRAFRALAPSLPRPRAIVSVSAHWFVNGTFVTGNEPPETIHDFGGFPEPLYALEYPAPGDSRLADRLVSLLGPARAAVRMDWGLDHGTWSVLKHLRPEADCPVIQLSLDRRLSPTQHLELGRALAALRHEGVLVMGSGNLTHNLRAFIEALGRGDTSTPEWASRFDAEAVKAVEQHDLSRLAALLATDDGRLAHPTPDHFMPLLYAAAAGGDDAVKAPIVGFDGGLSMRCFAWGLAG